MNELQQLQERNEFLIANYNSMVDQCQMLMDVLYTLAHARGGMMCVAGAPEIAMPEHASISVEQDPDTGDITIRALDGVSEGRLN